MEEEEINKMFSKKNKPIEDPISMELLKRGDSYKTQMEKLATKLLFVDVTDNDLKVMIYAYGKVDCRLHKVKSIAAIDDMEVKHHYLVLLSSFSDTIDNETVLVRELLNMHAVECKKMVYADPTLSSSIALGFFMSPEEIYKFFTIVFDSRLKDNKLKRVPTYKKPVSLFCLLQIYAKTNKEFVKKQEELVKKFVKNVALQVKIDYKGEKLSYVIKKIMLKTKEKIFYKYDYNIGSEKLKN